MSSKNVSLKNSKEKVSNLKSSRVSRAVAGAIAVDSDTNVYYGNDCVSRYWIYNEKLKCIAGNHVPCQYDELAEELKAKASKQRKAI